MIWAGFASSLRKALRWLLLVDRPVPPLSDGEWAAMVERHYRWNFAVNLLDGAWFWFGASFISSSTILPLFITKLTSSTWPIGLLAVISQAGWFLPQLFTANAVERLARKKPVVVNLGFFLERLPVWAMVAAALVAARSPMLALVIFFVGNAWFGLGAGVVATSWQDLIARCFPVDRRGRFMGITMFIGAGMGALGAGLCAWLLRVLPFPTNFVYVFAIAAMGISMSWVFLALTREPVQPITTPHQNQQQFWSGLSGILRNDHNFRRFLLARLLMAIGGSMGGGFITVAAVQRWQVSDSTVGGYTAALLVGETIANLLFGFLADKFGHKLSLELGCGAMFLAYALAWLAPSPEWYYAVFVLNGVIASAIIVSGILVVLEFCEPPRRPTYVGLANTCVGLVSMVAPLVGAGLASVNYNWLFGASAVISLAAALLMRWGVREPRWAG